MTTPAPVRKYLLGLRLAQIQLECQREREREASHEY